MSIFTRTSAIICGTSIIVSTILPVLAQDITAKQATATAAKRQWTQAVKPVAREKPGAAKEKIASREGALKAKLEKFRDQKKAALAERINANINTINQNRVKQWEKNLNSMSTILDKLDNRIKRGTSDIKDTEAAKSAIDLARTTIASASSAVSTQAQNSYTVNVTSESKIKADVKLQRDKLHNDISSVRKLLVEAKQRVADAIRIAKSGKAEIQNKEAKDGTE